MNNNTSAIFSKNIRSVSKSTFLYTCYMLFLLALAPSSASAQVYKCISSDEKIKFQSNACVEDEESERLKITIDFSPIKTLTKKQEIQRQLEKNRAYITRSNQNAAFRKLQETKNSIPYGHQALIEKRDRLKEKRLKLEQKAIDKCNKDFNVYCKKPALEIVRIERFAGSSDIHRLEPGPRKTAAIRALSRESELEKVSSELRNIEIKLKRME